MSTKNFYLQQEAKKGFKGWSKEALEFLLYKEGIEYEIQRECKKALEKLRKKSKDDK